MPAAVPQRMTAREFLELPERTTARRLQLLDGEVVVDDPTPRHQLAVTNVLMALRTWSSAETGRGFVTLNIDTRIDDHTVVSPDLQWYAADRDLPSLDRRPWPLGDLVVEVRSPSTWHVDVGRKRGLYERHGVRELWLVDPPAGAVLVFRRSAGSETFDATTEIGGDAELTSPLLPAFAVTAARLFAA
ncbi:Uma2 family endonuclease [Patulibacter sp. NPDC049589]|uniref:Uma2 family endonuclease n=1 Tax=Patulibacter sp. NPDC049589 TaxID=3154731 RepID=UPI00343181D9